MTDVFVSRPTWIAEPFQAGLDGFLGILQDFDLNPRTLGSTDYPVQSPLDEVIRIMRECSGAIILGYPQILVEVGQVKDIPVDEPLLLGTEWNHIEAGLAHACGLPMLIIHHNGIKRGIFDRGTVGRFIYEIDLERPEWPLAENIRGAVNTWRRSLLTTPANTSAEHTESISSGQAASDLNDIEVEILQLLAGGDGISLPAQAIAQRINQRLPRVEYHLQRLSDNEYIYSPLIMDQEPSYELDQRGREYLIGHDML